MEEGSENIRNTMITHGMDIDKFDLKQALALLSLPRVVGVHPDDGKEIKVGIGRFGPYVLHDGKFSSIRKGDDVLTVKLDRVLEIMKEYANRPKRGKGRGKKKSMKGKRKGK